MLKVNSPEAEISFGVKASIEPSDLGSFSLTSLIEMVLFLLEVDCKTSARSLLYFKLLAYREVSSCWKQKTDNSRTGLWILVYIVVTTAHPPKNSSMGIKTCSFTNLGYYTGFWELQYSSPLWFRSYWYHFLSKAGFFA